MTALARRIGWWTGAAGALALLAIGWLFIPASEPVSESTGSFSIAVTGDSFVVNQWPDEGSDPGFDEVVAVLRRASLAITNLEQTLRESATDAAGGWPVGSARTAADLRRAGFSVVTRANNHAGDHGDEGLRSTGNVLATAGLQHVGVGPDLNRARMPLFCGTPPRRAAVIAVTASASDEARATRTRDEIQGRPGVSSLRYSVEITADPATYSALAQIAKVPPAETSSPSGFLFSGRRVKRGSRISVDLVADERDRDEILGAISAARAQADVVILAIHSHEPGNLSQAPAPFVREFAHQAIDRGASLVVGTGPRQLRGIEIYQRRVILYSLGNFAFDASSIPPGAADVFDTNRNLNELALELPGANATRTLPGYAEDEWWESVVATATFEGSEVAEIRLSPIDLGVDLPLKERGRPRLAGTDRGRKILQRLADLSKEYGTTIRIENGAGLIHF